MAYDSSHSRTVQRNIRSATDAPRYFNDRSTNEICLVCVPSGASVVHMYLVVPAGYFVLYQKWHKNMGKLDAGAKWFWPAWYRISHIVNPGTITYSAPARRCPTADNILVDVNVSITFAVGPDAEAAQKFVYSLGANRFDELLSGQVEEAIRTLVYSVTHDMVNDLREDFASTIIASLKKKMINYGVDVKNCKITDVQLPRQLSEKLEQTTAFRTKISENAKKHENTMRVISDEATQVLEQINKENSRKKQNLNAACDLQEIDAKEKVEQAMSRVKIELLEAQGQIEVNLSKAKGDLEVSKLQSQKESEERIKQAQISCEERRVRADQDVHTQLLQSEAMLATEEAKAKGLIARAEAEGSNAKHLAIKRAHEIEIERLAVMKDMAGKGRRVIKGDAAQKILADMVPSTGGKKK